MDCVAVFVATAIALTVANVCRALKPLEEKVFARGCDVGLALLLNVPKEVCDEVIKYSPPDQLKKIITYYITRCPSASWRGLIWAVEWMEHPNGFDVVRERAEPVRGMQYREYG